MVQISEQRYEAMKRLEAKALAWKQRRDRRHAAMARVLDDDVARLIAAIESDVDRELDLAIAAAIESERTSRSE